MRVVRFLHKLLINTIHAKRVSVLSEAVESALETKCLTLTGLGRGINNKRQERSNIRKIDRLLGNEKLLAECKKIYQKTCSLLLQGIKQPIIIVDSVKLPHADMYALRASCKVGGRCHTLYELVHSKAMDGNIKLHQQFLTDLSEIIPQVCKPIVVTDAGFHNPWFKLVLSLGWDYIGRIRGLKKYCTIEKSKYVSCSNLWKKATKEAKFVGEVILTRKNPLHCYFYLYKRKLKGRLTKKQMHKDKLAYARSQREPWVLASSLGKGYKAKQIIKTYQFRMKIEESFRDMKSSRYGLGLERARTKQQGRYTILLLIVMLTNFIACLMGQAVELKEQHYEFQANSTRSRRVLSYFYLGCQAFRKRLKVTFEEIKAVLQIARLEFAVPA